METTFTDLIEPIARELLGEPNQKLSGKTELRYGSHGSMSVDLKKGTFYDHEAGQGGGVLELITRQTGLEGADCFRWMTEKGFYTEHHGGNGQFNRITTTYDYIDEAGQLLFQVCRYEPKDFRQRKPDGHGG